MTVQEEKYFFLQVLQFLTSFLELEKVRRDDFEYTIFLEGNMENICIPPLLFIPSVENAVKHNLDSDNLSYVHLYFSVHNKQLTFRCENCKTRVPVKRERDRVGQCETQTGFTL